jgi:hypothetical protein
MQSLKFYQKKEMISVKYENVKKDLSDLEKDYNKKINYLEFIKTDRGYEEYLRDTLPVAAPGEMSIILYNSSNSSVTEYATSTPRLKLFLKKVKFFIENYTNL